MDIKLVNIGFGNIVSANRIIAIVSPESAPIKRIIQEARDRGMLIDATYGRRTRAVIITDSDHVVLSAVQPETVAHRLSNDKNSMEDEDENEEMIEVIDEPTNQINDDEDIPSKEDETDEHFYEDLADMDYDENEDERPIDDDLMI